MKRARRRPGARWPRAGTAVLAAALAALAAHAGGAAAGRGEAKKGRKYEGDCLREGCHAGLAAERAVHGPVAVRACDACHEPAPGEHRFRLARRGEGMCAFCHEIPPRRKVVHRPIIQTGCTECHDPHASANRALLRRATPGALCTSCHTLLEAAHPHEPSREGACLACHAPHQSDVAGLLLQPERRLCLGCHEGVEKELEAEHVHEPAGEGCTACHAPHSAPEAGLLPKPLVELCLNCHEDIRKAMASRETLHGALTEFEACLNCHRPHGGGLAFLLKDAPMPLCLRCHSAPIRTRAGRTLRNMARVLEGSPFLHGPIREADCAACHTAHGSSNFRLLRRHFPRRFYEGFDLDKYALCFSCHPSALVLTRRTRMLTRFRDGDRNLHYVHVNDKVKGRSCRACHPVHGSRGPEHIRRAIPFGKGNWLLPLHFEKTATGGRCAPGCHDPERYDTTKAAGR